MTQTAVKNSQITKFADQDQVIESLRGLLQIESTSGDAGPVTEEAPLGENINKAINYVLELGKSFGFRTSNIGGMCGWVEMGNEDSDEMVGILAHVDTVPVSEGWEYKPFDATVEDGRIYGRGTNDDKGPAIAALYAMKAVADSGIPLDRRIRLIVGGDEENGLWRCMARYKETEEIPTCSFSPDADYPVIFAEKGILGVKIASKPGLKGDDLTFDSGTVINIVPAEAHAEAGGKKYQAKGTPAHAMEPFKGDNALLKLGKLLEQEGVKHPFLDLLDIADTKGLGIDVSDDVSGELTFNPAVAHVDADGAELECDIRYPVTLKGEDFAESIRQAVEPLGFTVEITKNVAPLYVDKNSELVQKLLKVYQDVTGEDAEPISLGGGTYARAFDNAVAFGILFPGEPNMCHQTNEYWPVDDLNANMRIMAEAIAALGAK
ncbi:MAG: Sapep family Mn(2+)-dependent dipeptidase [Eubacteriaceae bacterium]|jgi:succinyl-diaminopimelate desuccinylase